MATQAQLAAVQQLYVGYLGRAADSAGQQFWANAIANGTATIASVATGFTLSAEYKAAYGGLTTDALVEKVYNNVLGRTPDAEGKAFWVAALANGKVTADTLVATIVTNLGALDQQTINNKVFVAQTYTDTVGASYNAESGADVISNVTSDPATVTEALANIAAGTIGGSVPGAAQIAAVVAAGAELTALEKAIAASNPDLDSDDSGSVTKAEADQGLTDAEGARDGISLSSTAELNTAVTTANSDLAKAKALVAASGPAAVAAQKTYDNAVAAQKALVGDTLPATAETNAIAATDTAITAVDTALNSGATNLATSYAKLSDAYGSAITDAATLEVALKSADSAQKTALVAELVKLPSYGQSAVDAVAKEQAIVAANDAVDTAAASPDFGTSGYVAAATAAVNAADTLAKATVADEAVAAAKAVVDQYTAVNDKITLAETALNTYKAANTDKVVIHDDLAGQANTAVGALDAKSDVFYFSSVDKTATNDFAIGTASTAATKFGAGDSIVLGKDFTFNSGALSTGDNNKAEFFLVQKGADTLVVIETQNYGSSTTDTTVAVTSPDAAVITLTGVNVADLTVSNGVISHVA